MSWSHSFSGQPPDMVAQVKLRVDAYFVYEAAEALITLLKHLHPHQTYSVSTHGHANAGVIDSINVSIFKS